MKIGFLATGGLRVCDPKLIQLGMTMPSVVQRARTIASLPSLGLLYLAAVTPPGHQLFYWEAMLEDKTAGESNGQMASRQRLSIPAEAFNCDVVAISTLTAQVFEAYEMADRLRAAGVCVVVGGLHASAMIDEASSHADHVVMGEGEYVWPKLLEAIALGSSRKIWDAADFGVVDVRQLPVPRYDLLGNRPYNRFTVQTSRGCPWRCDFCASNVMLGLPYRKRVPAHVKRDIEKLIELYDRPFVEFADDNTFVDKGWSKELCSEIAPLGVQWFTETDISVADDEELLVEMRSAGCRQVLIGFESPDPQPLRGIELRSDFKARRYERSREAISRVQDHGITVNACFILGLDGHSPAIFENVLRFVEETKPFDVQITVMTPFPGTPLYDRLLTEGRILYPGRWDLCTLFDVNYRPTNMSVDELRAGLYWLAERLYNEPAVQARQRDFIRRLFDVRATLFSNTVVPGRAANGTTTRPN